MRPDLRPLRRHPAARFAAMLTRRGSWRGATLVSIALLMASLSGAVASASRGPATSWARLPSIPTIGLPPGLHGVLFRITTWGGQYVNWSFSQSGLAAGESCTEQLNSSGVDYFAFNSRKSESLRYDIYFAKNDHVLAIEQNLANVIPGHPEMTAEQERDGSLTRTYTGVCAPGQPGNAPTTDCGKEIPGLVPVQAISYDETRHRLILGQPQIDTPYTRSGATFNCPLLDLDTSPPLELQTTSIAGTPDLSMLWGGKEIGHRLLALKRHHSVTFDFQEMLVPGGICTNLPGCQSGGQINWHVRFTRLR